MEGLIELSVREWPPAVSTSLSSSLLKTRRRTAADPFSEVMVYFLVPGASNSSDTCSSALNAPLPFVTR
ncbi:MAG: hypothetical protein ACLQOO_36400 [Terriglobia bacterium]